MKQIVVTVEKLFNSTGDKFPTNRFSMIFDEEELSKGTVTYAVQETDQDKLLYISLRRGSDEA